MRRFAIVLLAVGLPVFAETVPGIDNFYKVDNQVYRGAQPSAEGFRYLASLGVKTVIDLREADSRSRLEQQEVTAAGLQFVSIPMTGLTPPTEAQIGKILAILNDRAAGPVFVHCKRGADRTGAVMASYRIQHDGWDNTRALQEAMERGMSPFQHPRQHFIRDFQAATGAAKTASTAAAASIQ